MLLVSRSFFFFRKVFPLLLCLLPFAASHAHSRGSITGQVTDSNGMPLEGVAVSVQGGPSTLSNAGGLFTLSDVKQKERVVVTFRKNGYLSTQGTVSLQVKSRTDRGRRTDDHKSSRSDREDDDHNESESSGKLAQASILRRMLKLGATQSINTANGGVVREAGSKVTLLANSLTVNGDVQVTVTPIDVSTDAIFAAPGDFMARTSNGQQVMLETFTMADVTLSQNGQPVNLAPGARALLEILLPASTPLQVGDTKPMWYYSEQNGLWIEEGVGTVGASTEVAGRLAVFAEVAHFTPWNCDQPLPNVTVVRGRVVDASGNPVAGAYVEGSGSVPFRTAARATTDINGYYCMSVPLSVTIGLRAYYSISGLYINGSNTTQITTPSVILACGSPSVPVAANLAIDTAVSCVRGDVLNATGAPVAGVTVYSSTGGFSTTDVAGAYQLPAPANSPVVVYSAGYPSVSVTTGAAGGACASAPLRITTGSGVACVSGFLYQCNVANRYPGVSVLASDMSGSPLGLSQPSNANGDFCIDGLPANATVRLTGNGFYDTVTGDRFRDASTGTGGGTCATGGCNAIPGIDVYCY